MWDRFDRRQRCSERLETGFDLSRRHESASNLGDERSFQCGEFSAESGRSNRVGQVVGGDLAAECRIVRKEDALEIRDLQLAIVEAGLNRTVGEGLSGVFVPRVSFLFDAEHGRPVFEEDSARIVLAVQSDRGFTCKEESVMVP